jgi:hypothetical protein
MRGSSQRRDIGQQVKENHGHRNDHHDRHRDDVVIAMIDVKSSRPIPG